MAKREIADSRTIVTGASGGVGREIVRELARRGGHTVAVARREEELRGLANEIAQDPALAGRLEWVAGDVTDRGVRESAIERARSAFGGLDAVVNNAAVGAFGRFADGDPQRLRDVMEINFFAAAELAREALPELQQGRNPIVVFIGSILGHRGIPRMNEYCASKFALRGLTESLRVEVRPAGIDVLLVSPGTIKSDFYENVVHGRGAAPWKQGRAIPASTVARQTVSAMRRGKREIAPNYHGRLLILANRCLPSVVDRFLARYA